MSTIDDVDMITGLITGDELFDLGNIGPCELIDGRIVLMSPTGGEHGGLETSLAIELGIFVRQHKLGYLAGGEVGIYIQRNPDRIRGADLAFFTHAQLPNGLPRRFIEAVPTLVVEIASPTDRWQDIRDRIRDYFSIGTQQIWIIEPEAQVVEVYSSPTELRELRVDDTLEGTGPLAGFRLPLKELFGAGRAAE